MKYRRNKKALIAFGKRLKELRLSQNLTQEELAYKANMEIKQIGSIERGEINCGLSFIYDLADALTINPSKLFD